MVDIARSSNVKRQKKIRRAIYGTVALLAIIVISYGVSRLKPAAPTVDSAVVWVETVKRGPMLRQVRGSGTLVPEDIRWIPAQTQGRVEQIVLHPGAQVKPDTVILVLSNPELKQSVQDAELAYHSAEAAYENRKAELQTQLLAQEADTAKIESDYKQASLTLEANEQLAKDGLVSDLQLKQYRGQTDELKNSLALAQKRLTIAREGVSSQIAPQQADVDSKRADWELKKRQLDDLRVKAGMSGILQLVPVEVGAQVAPGTNLARVADPTNLKAELRIAETQTKDIKVGQYAEVDTRNGIVKGHVSRIDPSSQNGTRGVDVIFSEALPPGAVPDLSVDGTVLLEKLDNVINVGRPAFGQENSTVNIFKVLPDNEAVRVPVKLGRASVNQIEVLSGLQPGDRVILSDMSQYDQYDRVQLK
ncbi:MAG TPA: efflux RND transporter periplasmic adaptor subunit [Vicinamibacterales bacterium]|nr:efflux RND transporter periplasmic adaptor subunit [Vicinamibacterales bacterium]